MTERLKPRETISGFRHSSLLAGLRGVKSGEKTQLLRRDESQEENVL